ncbi:MAG: phosphoribosylformylglycinamidine synthase subunit PurL [Candidatus Promineifilaceae bacterium]
MAYTISPTEIPPGALPLNPDSDRLTTLSIEVRQRQETGNGAALDFTNSARQLGLVSLDAAQIERLYFVRGQVTETEVEQLGRQILADPVTEIFVVRRLHEGQWRQISPRRPDRQTPVPSHWIDVTFLPGVTDSAADNLVHVARLLGLDGLERAATGQRFLLWGALQPDELRRLAVEICANPVIQRFAIDQQIIPPFFSYQSADETVATIPVRLADDETLDQISRERRLALDLAEMQAIRDYYRAEARDPTDVELEMLAQTWSEHCVHKTFKARIHYTGPPAADPLAPSQQQTINGLLRTYIRQATQELAKPWVRSAFVDNAGIVAFDDHWDLAFKVETHNHPSALEPFGGANTGVGGVIRDVLGVSAQPIANTDILCFGPPDLAEEQLPAGILHPRRIAEGVIRGVEDYGNKMGIPTVNGAIIYHQGYTANPLVYCGCLGLLPRGSHPVEAQPGDLIIAIGGRTGRDGLRGATFSSMEMDTTTGEIAGSAVQIGNPIQEKQVMEVVLQARDEGLYSAITDCGAGGFSSAVGEMGSRLGAQVQLANAPLKYPGLQPWEIWLSEAQERMVLAVPTQHWPRLQEICAGQNVEAVCIGSFEDTNRLRIFYRERLVGDLDMTFLHDGYPQRELEATWQPASPDQPGEASRAKLAGTVEAGTTLRGLLCHPNIRSREEVIRRYDHEVQGGTVVKPLVGAAGHGPGDAAVLVPQGTYRPGADPGPTLGLALANGICPTYGELDPYAMAWAAVDEAMRNVTAVGADPDRVALLDNFCWGNPNLPDRLGGLVRCAQGCYEAAMAYRAPFVSGKDSLNNEYTGADGRKHAIPGTLLISALGIVPEVKRTMTMDLKQPGNLLFLIGRTRAELGGSHYAQLVGGLDDSPPVNSAGGPPRPVVNALGHLRALHQAIKGGLVSACHDCAEGGLAVTLAEMCLAGRLGLEVDLATVPFEIEPAGLGAVGGLADEILLFAESLTRFVVEVPPEKVEAFDEVMAGVPHAQIGQIVDTGQLRIVGQAGQTVIDLPIAELEEAWRGAPPAKGGKPMVSPKANPGAWQIDQDGLVGIPVVLGRPRVAILHANGTNRDREAALACELAGGEPEIVHINQLLDGQRRLLDYGMLVVPGGFSYGDDLGAGTLWAFDLGHRLGADVVHFAETGRPLLGICNGFQALVKSGLLPGAPLGSKRQVTLGPNESARFECRWVYLQSNPNSPCRFLQGLDELIYCPVAHGEGRLATRSEEVTAELEANGLVALTYVDICGRPASYPANPNGSTLNIAGLCNQEGNILGLMPHPEDHIFPWQHPRWHRGETGFLGLGLFENGIKLAKEGS